MAATEFGSGSVHAVQRWSNKLAREALGQTYFKKFAGTSEESIIQIHKDLETQPGDQIHYDVLYQDRGDGVQGDTTLEGYEGALEFYQDTLYVDQLRWAHNFRGMTQQRTVHDLRNTAKKSLGAWYAWKYDTLMFAYLAGVAGDSNESAQGTLGLSGFAGNALQTPDAAHTHTVGSAFTIGEIDKLVAKAKVLNPRMRPININGERKFVLVLHPYQVYSMKQTAVEGNWQMLHARIGENGSKNPIYSGALGEYAGVVIHESEFVPRVTATNLNYGLFLGAQAGAFAMGNAYQKVDQQSMGGGSYFRWTEQVRDYGNNKGIGVASCFGIKKNRFNSADFGCIQVNSVDSAP